MNDKQAANTAIANLDGFNIKGQRMRVEVSVCLCQQVVVDGSPKKKI